MFVVAVALFFILFFFGGGRVLWPSWICDFSSHYFWKILSYYLLNISSAQFLLLSELKLQAGVDIIDSAVNLPQLLDALCFSFCFSLGNSTDHLHIH